MTHKTTVAQMIAWLQTQDPTAEVECGKEETKHWETSMIMVPVDIDECAVFDYTSDADRAKYPHMAGKKIVSIRGY